MSQAAGQQPEQRANPPRPIVKTMRWPVLGVWLIPALALGLAGYYVFDYFAHRGPMITVKFNDATGLKPGQSHLMHLGVTLGDVTDIELTPDKKQTLVHIQVNRANDAFAKAGATFWIVRPEISVQQVSGLGTVLSGPFIDATPGSGDKQTEFAGLANPPVTLEDGLHIVLNTPRIDQLEPKSPVYYRGVQVGIIENAELNSDATHVEVHAFIHRRFSALVTVNSQFWVISSVDVKGGLLTGVQMKVGSLSSLLAGGVGFATPDKNWGSPAVDGSQFNLNSEAKQEWLDWSPHIQIGPDESTVKPTPNDQPKALLGGGIN
jgi:paraquat-inducible protein B